jgi:ribosomal protein L37E
MNEMKNGGPVLSRMGEHPHSRPRPSQTRGMRRIFASLGAVLILFLALWSLPSHGLAAENDAASSPPTQNQSVPSADQPKKDDKPTVLKCPRCGSTEIRSKRCTQCGFRIRTRRAKTGDPALHNGTDSKLRSLDTTRQDFGRSMRSLDESVRRMNTDINRTRNLYRQFR